MNVISNPRSWQDSLRPQIAAMRAALRQLDPATLTARSGATYHAAGPDRGQFRLSFMQHEYLLDYPTLIARRASTGDECPLDLQNLFLSYLHTADGTPLSGHWIAFRELPDGGFYHRAFQGYTGGRLAKALGNDPAAFRQAAQQQGGQAETEIGDAAFSFTVLPRVRLLAVYWLGDDEFPPNANILFDAAASHYMSTDGLAVLGSWLVDWLLEAAGRLDRTARGAERRGIL